MEALDMSPHDTSALDNTMNTPYDTALDAALRQHFRNEAEPDDDGFSQRVMAALPARPLRRQIRWIEWVERAQWTAISLAACGVATLASINDVSATTAHNVAAYTLIGLLIYWAIPSRWSRG
jgi:hypothetical protein